MGKLAAILLVLAVLLSAVFMVHGVWSGICPPYPDPTPEQREHARYHGAISSSLFLAAGVAWIPAGIATAAYTVRSFVRVGRSC